MNKGRTPRWACGSFLMALLLGACGDSSRPSAEESEQLNNAEKMLDQADNELAGIEENTLDKSEPDPAAQE